MCKKSQLTSFFTKYKIILLYSTRWINDFLRVPNIVQPNQSPTRTRKRGGGRMALTLTWEQTRADIIGCWLIEPNIY